MAAVATAVKRRRIGDGEKDFHSKPTRPIARHDKFIPSNRGTKKHKNRLHLSSRAFQAAPEVAQKQRRERERNGEERGEAHAAQTDRPANSRNPLREEPGVVLRAETHRDLGEESKQERKEERDTQRERARAATFDRGGRGCRGRKGQQTEAAPAAERGGRKPAGEACEIKPPGGGGQFCTGRGRATNFQPRVHTTAR